MRSFSRGDYFPVPLDVNTSKELFSDAYVRAVVSAAGMDLERKTTDRDSVDGWITYTGLMGEVFSPQLAFQLKCTSSVHFDADNQFVMRLGLKNYDELRITNTGMPRVLIAVTVPADIESWVVHNDQDLLLRRTAYWRSLEGEPESDNTVRVTVRIPSDQRFTVDGIKDIMRRIGDGSFP